MNKAKILWVDDEIEMLRAHIRFLEEKGYEVKTVTNGEDAVSEVSENIYDLIFLDEMMAGLGGLETLARIKEINPNIQVVMITKNEEESLMHDAIGSKISDYLIKPVLPSQILMVCKKLLESREISRQYVAKDYLEDFNEISGKLLENLDYKNWIEIYMKLVNWELEMDSHPEVGLRQTLTDQKKECNQEFSKYIEKNYKSWIENAGLPNVPTLSPEIIEKYVLEEVENSEGPVFFFVLDCLRMDQWIIMEKHLIDLFEIRKQYYYSILPSATPYARNSLFSGLFPLDIEKYYPDLWESGRDDEKSRNRYEKDLLQLLLNRNNIKLRNELKYLKIINPVVGKSFEQNIQSHQNTHFMAVVVNFLDMIAHGRSDSDLLKEIAPEEAAYRSLTNSWFMHSSLLGTFKTIASMKNAKLIVTTDHGSIRSLRGLKVLGDKDASTSLRFKYGRNLHVDEKHALIIKNPEEFKLPRRSVAISYIIAKEDYFFVYPTDFHKYLNYYKDTFQHGGISMEEMILPIIKMESKV